MICGYCKEDKLGVILNILNDLPCYIKVHVNHIENKVQHVEQYKEKKRHPTAKSISRSPLRDFGLPWKG